MKAWIKSVSIGALIAFSSASFAVDTTDFSKPGMKQLAVEKRAMETCMENVDEIQQIALEAKLNDLDNQLLNLCHAGKLAEARATALRLSSGIIDSVLFQKVQGCTQGMRDLGFLPPLPVVRADSKALQTICQNYLPYSAKVLK